MYQVIGDGLNQMLTGAIELIRGQQTIKFLSGMVLLGFYDTDQQGQILQILTLTMAFPFLTPPLDIT